MSTTLAFDFAIELVKANALGPGLTQIQAPSGTVVTAASASATAPAAVTVQVTVQVTGEEVRGAARAGEAL